MNKLQKFARDAAQELLELGGRKRSWTPEERIRWTRAFNALQRLAGKDTVLQNGKLRKEAKRGA